MSADVWSDVPSDTGEAYEQLLVPAVFEQWVPVMLDAGGVGRGHRVLDVACGTGVVARGAFRRVGSSGSVVGLDLTESMLRTAGRIEPGVEWRLGDAALLPFNTGSFDVVLSQAGLMFFPDKVGAVAEMRRVLRDDGRAVVLVWARSSGHDAVASVVERLAGPEARSRYLMPWSFSDPDDLLTVMSEAGFGDVDVDVRDGSSVYSSLEHFLASSMAVLLAGIADSEELVNGVREALASYRRADGGYEIPGPANIAIATKT